jgi:hypothetical protein
MISPLFSRTPGAACFTRLSGNSTRLSESGGFEASDTPHRKRWIAVSAAALFALALAATQISAQQPYAAPQYGSGYGSGYGNSYAGQYAQPQYAPQQPYAQQQPQYSQPQYSAQQPYAQQSYPAQAPYPEQQDFAAPAAAPVQALSADQLAQLLAPIALYPDALLAQVLAASTYPAQVAVADQWMQQMRSQGYGSPDQIANGASAQTSWDPSVKALTAFPDVLDMMDQNLNWTTNLGNAYYNQPQDVMQTVQVLRQRAEQAGNLQSTPQEQVSNDQGYIDLAPQNPEQVYVPTYNPWDVYGQPVSPYPGFSLAGALGNFFGSSPIQYALSFAMGAFDHTPFSLLSWGLDWLANAIFFNHSDYYSNSASVADWGLPYGGPRAHYGRGGAGYGRGADYGRGGNDRWAGNGNYNRGSGGDQRGNYSGPPNYNQRGDSAGNQRGGWNNAPARPGNFERPALGIPYNSQRSDGSNRGEQPYAFNRGTQPAQNTYTHPAAPGEQAYNRAATQPAYSYRPQTYPNRQQTYSNPGYGSSYAPHAQTYPDRSQTYASRGQTFSTPGYGSGYGNAPRSTYGYSGPSYGARPNYAYAAPAPSYRAPQSNDSRGFSGGYSYGGNPYGGSMAKNDHSGGFHLFGGGNSAPKGFSGGRAPSYSYKSPKNSGGFGGGHAPKSFGGGHQSAPKASHGGGGGSHHRF